MEMLLRYLLVRATVGEPRPLWKATEWAVSTERAEGVLWRTWASQDMVCETCSSNSCAVIHGQISITTNPRERRRTNVFSLGEDVAESLDKVREIIAEELGTQHDVLAGERGGEDASEELGFTL